MLGDRHKPRSRFCRWIDHFWDGEEKFTKKGSSRIPSHGTLKKYEKKWRRRKEKQDLRNNNNDNQN